MNRYQKAFNITVKYNFCGDCRWAFESERCKKTGCYQDVKTMEELVEKATPKKVLDVYDTYFDIYLFGRCPTCLKNVNSGMNGCPYCLQALDWSVKDD